MPSYYDEKTKKWYCKFYYQDRSEVRHQKLKRGFNTKKEAAAWERNFLLSCNESPDMLFSTLVELYLDDARLHTKASTHLTRKNRIDVWIAPYFNDMQLSNITPAHIRKWQNTLKEATGRGGKPLSAAYLNNISIDLSGIFNFAVKYHGLKRNPCSISGTTIAHKKKRVDFWTQNEFNTFIKTFDTDHHYVPLFMILYYTGMRCGECLALTPNDIDLDSGVIHVRKTVYNRIITEPKTEKANRDIPIPGFLVDIIRQYEARIYDLRPDTLLFPMAAASVRICFSKHIAKTELKRIRVHDLRHSHASLLIECGFSPLVIAERLGHENVSTTLDIYSHLYPSKQSEIVDKLEDLYQKIVSN